MSILQRMPSKSKAVNAKRQTPKCPICLEEFVDKVKIRFAQKFLFLIAPQFSLSNVKSSLVARV